MKKTDKQIEQERAERREKYIRAALLSLAGGGAAYFATKNLPSIVINKVVQQADNVAPQAANTAEAAKGFLHGKPIGRR